MISMLIVLIKCYKCYNVLGAGPRLTTSQEYPIALPPCRHTVAWSGEWQITGTRAQEFQWMFIAIVQLYFNIQGACGRVLMAKLQNAPTDVSFSDTTDSTSHHQVADGEKSTHRWSRTLETLSRRVQERDCREIQKVTRTNRPRENPVPRQGG